MTNTKLNYDSKNITLDGRTGTWKVIANGYADPTYQHFVYLVESEQLGDQTNYLIINKRFEVISDRHTSIYEYGVEVHKRIYGY